MTKQQTHIPLIVKFPESEGSRHIDNRLVESIDLGANTSLFDRTRSYAPAFSVEIYCSPAQELQKSLMLFLWNPGIISRSPPATGGPGSLKPCRIIFMLEKESNIFRTIPHRITMQPGK